MAERDAPIRSGFLQLDATWNPDDGGTAKLEAGYHPLQNVEAFAFAQADQATGIGAGVGVRWDF